MAGGFAVSLGAIAMATVIVRGAIAGDAAVGVIYASLVTLIVFSAIGWVAGAAMDVLVRQDLEEQFRRRLSRFREEVEAVGGESKDEARRAGQDA